jgi:predicted amidohydrolase
MQMLHAACGQIVCRPGDMDHNLDQIEDLTAQAAKAGADVILFAEGAITGYVFTDHVLEAAPTADGAVMRRLRKISRTHRIAVAAGTIERSRRGLHVSHFVAFPRAKPIVQRKHRLTPTEQKVAIAGPERRTLFKVKGVTCAIAICADSGIPDLHNKLARRGCQVYMGPCAGGGPRRHRRTPEDLEDPKLRKRYLSDMKKVCYVGDAIDQCVRHHMALVSVNLAGDDGIDHYHPGHSTIIDSRGRLVALRPGEYVADFLRPQLIQGQIMVQKPRALP